ncbi:MAG: hypothetical protein VKS61_09200 [Candidatus Sericytochromatia bacterium]|nr:hypothetical protein [Candidatus Sericytochromatia bacterium]
MLHRRSSHLLLATAAWLAACASPSAVESPEAAAARGARRTTPSAASGTPGTQRTKSPPESYAEEVTTSASPRQPASPSPSQDAAASSAADAAASPTVAPPPAGLPDVGPCTAPAPTASPEPAAAALGAYAGQLVPAGWNTAFPSEAQVTAEITKLAREPAARACFQQRHPGAALVHHRLTELTAQPPGAPRTVTEVQVSLATLVLKAGLKTSVAGTVTYSDGTRDGAVIITSDAPDIVALDAEPGGITAVKAGTTTLRVKAAADETKGATITVTVL